MSWSAIWYFSRVLLTSSLHFETRSCNFFSWNYEKRREVLLLNSKNVSQVTLSNWLKCGDVSEKQCGTLRIFSVFQILREISFFTFHVTFEPWLYIEASVITESISKPISDSVFGRWLRVIIVQKKPYAWWTSSINMAIV